MDVMSMSSLWFLSSFKGINYIQNPGSIMNSFRANRYYAISYMFEHELLLMDTIHCDLNIIHHRVWWFVKAIHKELYDKRQTLSLKTKCNKFIDIMDYHGISMNMIDALFIKNVIRRPLKMFSWFCVLRCLHTRRSL
jgi:hypothetical protein